MYLLLSIALVLSVSGRLEALSCFGHTCNDASQYCQIQLLEKTGFCYTHHGHGHHEDHQQCTGNHHLGDHCFCKDQICIDTIVHNFTTDAPTTKAVTAPVTTDPHVNLITCEGIHVCHANEICEHKLVHGSLTSRCRSEHYIQHYIYRMVDCQTVAVLTDHQMCYCRTNACNDKIIASTLIPNTSTTLAASAATTTQAQTALVVTQAHTATTPIVTCADKEDALFTCQAYNDQFGMCLSNTITLQTIARKRCPKFCGFCGNSHETTVTQSPLVGTLNGLVCIDHDPRCKLYKSLLCSAASPETKKYVISTCAKTCNFCPEYIASIVTTNIPTTQTTTTVPTTPSVITTLAASTPAPIALCQDKPGVDCRLLNTTNICANPFSNTYCPAFCGHCVKNVDSFKIG